MIQAIEPLNELPKTKVALSTPLLASYLSKQYRVTDIAKACNVSKSAVSQAISKRLDQLLPLIDNKDVLSALKAKHIADLAQDKLIKHLPSATKKQLATLNLISGVHIDKYRLLSDKSTSNVSIDAIHSRREDRQQRREELLKELSTVRNEPVS